MFRPEAEQESGRTARQINPTAEDFRELLRRNPMAAQQLENIVLTRLLEASEAKASRSNCAPSDMPSLGGAYGPFFPQPNKVTT